jgi:hypothetical protein
LAAAQYTRTEIREYISALQSHNEPCSLGTSTKCLPTPGESYPRHIRKKKKPPNTSPQQPSAKVSHHPQPTSKHDQLCQQWPWDPQDTSDPSSYSDSDSDDYGVAVDYPTQQDNPNSDERPCTRRDTTVSHRRPDDNEAPSPDGTNTMVGQSTTIPKKTPPKRHTKGTNQDTRGRA